MRVTVAMRGAARGRWSAAQAALAVAFALLVLWPAGALAEPPFRLQDQATDEVGALSGRENEIEAALAELRAKDGVQLWVVYVDSFDGVPARDWANEAARISDLGLNDVLLAVAVGDRAYSYSVDQQSPLTDEQLAAVATDFIEPLLADDDWAGAVIAATEGIAQALGQTSPPSPPPSTVPPGGLTPDEQATDGASSNWTLRIGVALVAVAVLVWWLVRRGRSSRTSTVEQIPGAPSDTRASVTTQELAREAGRLLVETDDAVKTSEQEVGFVEAQFGPELAAPFAQAVAASKADMSAAFQLQQGLNDSEPETKEARRAMLLEIIRVAEQAGSRLDAQAERFDELRDLERNAPQVIASLTQELGATADRIPDGERILAELRRLYALGAVTSVAGNITQAQERVAFAREHLAAARGDVDAGNAGLAVPDLVAAEAASGQARQLLDAIERLATDLGQADGKIQAALAETERDLAEAQAFSAAHPAVAAPAAAAVVAVTAARQAAGPDGGQDPLAALRRLEEADAALEQVLVGARDEQQRQARARAILEHALDAARAQIAAVDDFITTRRGRVGGSARAMLADAQRHYQLALAAWGTDPSAALGEAQAADDLAQRALQAARDDEAGGDPSDTGGTLADLAGALLGGILINTAMGGGPFRSGGSRGGRGSLGPASFGGLGTRTRRGGGGRF